MLQLATVIVVPSRQRVGERSRSWHHRQDQNLHVPSLVQKI